MRETLASVALSHQPPTLRHEQQHDTLSHRHGDCTPFLRLTGAYEEFIAPTISHIHAPPPRSLRALRVSSWPRLKNTTIWHPQHRRDDCPTAAQPASAVRAAPAAPLPAAQRLRARGPQDQAHRWRRTVAAAAEGGIRQLPADRVMARDERPRETGERGAAQVAS